MATSPTVRQRELGKRLRVLRNEHGLTVEDVIGGPAIMAAQLAKILDAERQGKVTVQVVPFETGAHVAQDSNFIFFEFEESAGLSPG